MPHRSFSAIAPIVMSLVALAVVLVPVDEAAATPLFQLLLVGQAPIVAFFAVKWLPREPAHSLQVLGAQAFAAALALLPVVVLGS